MEESRGARGGLRSAFLISTLPFQRASALKSRISWKGKLPGFSSSVVVLSKKKSVTTKSNAKVSPSLSPAFTDSNGFGKGPAGGKGEKILMWFRADLRLHDHPALKYVEEHASAVLPLFTFDPRQFGKTSFGFAKTGRYRAEFLIEAVDQLRKRLRDIGSDLIIREGKPEEVIVNLCRQNGIRKVVYHREVCFEEQEVEQKLHKALATGRIEHKAMWSNTLYDVEDLPFAVEKMPDVYSKFRDMVQEKGQIREALPAPKKLPRTIDCESGRLPTLSDLGLGSEPARNLKTERFTGGEIDAMGRLEKYIAEAKRNSGTASSHLGADFSCKISPWLALGCVSPRRIHQELKKRNVVPEISKSTTYFELVWRDFFRFITLKYGASRLRTGANSAAGSRAQALTSSGIKEQMMSAAH